MFLCQGPVQLPRMPQQGAHPSGLFSLSLVCDKSSQPPVIICSVLAKEALTVVDAPPAASLVLAPEHLYYLLDTQACNCNVYYLWP